jgi:hypothetical protein
MKIANLSVYKLHKLSCSLLFGIAAYAFINANNTDVIATAPVTEEQTQSTPNRHTITLVLNQPEDLKVEKGQRINVGDIISDLRSIAVLKDTASHKGIAPPKKPNYKPKNSD